LRKAEKILILRVFTKQAGNNTISPGDKNNSCVYFNIFEGKSLKEKVNPVG